MELFSCQPLTEQQHRIRNESGGSATRDTKTSIHDTRLANTNSSIPKATREPSQESVYLTASSRATLLSLGKISISSSRESMKPIFKVLALNPQKACVSADGYRFDDMDHFWQDLSDCDFLSEHCATNITELTQSYLPIIHLSLNLSTPINV